MSKEGDFIASIRFLAKVLDNDLSDTDLLLPAGLLQAVTVDFLEKAGHKQEAEWVGMFNNPTAKLKEETAFVSFCRNILNHVVSDENQS